MLKKLLAHPLTRDLDVDDPRTTQLRQRIVLEKPFLKKIYEEWYALLNNSLPAVDGPVLELGSGAGFLPDVMEDVISSEIFHTPGIDTILDGQKLPFADESLRGIVMTDVMHHLPQMREFLSEASRCVKPGGVLSMIEPWHTPWAKLIYQNLHSEPFAPGVKDWEFPTSGPLSGSNQALPWIVFERDRAVFQKEFPQWEIHQIQPMMPLRYLLSGGVSMRSLMPAFSYPLWRGAERLLNPWMDKLGMFALVVLYKK